ncbi:ferredoxin reductase family protein [Carnobacterium funditum]|uniref:ferredoxin reductase family protein n=1 Tax=Carnobacterium funditum TaxID=2752 RepID=UPI0005584521|nr:FAD-binding oxidoreductase [Carnobacterium funditum]
MKRKVIQIMILAVYFLSPLPIAFISLKGLNFSIAAPAFIGIISYTWLLSELITAARPKFIEKHFSLDKFHRFHGIMAIVALALGMLHKEWASLAWGEFEFSTVFGDFAIMLFLLLTVLSVLFMTGWLRRIKIINVVLDTLGNFAFAKYGTMKFLHNFTIVAIISLSVHVITIAYVVRADMTLTMMYALYFIVSLSFYVYHKLIRRFLLNKNIYTITSAVNETDQLVSLTLEAENGQIFDYNAGQFIYLRVKDEKYTFEEHPFSLTSAPENPHVLSVSIKNSGDYTHIIQHIKVGTKVTVEGPYGGLWQPLEDIQKTEKSLVLIAGGVGVTPMLSILESLRQKKFKNKTVLIWSLRNENELAYAAELASFQKDMPNFIFVPFYSTKNGYLNAEKTETIFEATKVPCSTSEFVLCGPKKFMHTIESALVSKNVSKQKIHFESFGL